MRKDYIKPESLPIEMLQMNIICQSLGHESVPHVELDEAEIIDYVEAESKDRDGLWNDTEWNNW